MDCQLLGKIFKNGKYVTDMSRVELRFNLCNLVILCELLFYLLHICKNAARIVISQRRIYVKIIDMQVIVWENKFLEYYKIAEVYTFLSLSGCAQITDMQNPPHRRGIGEFVRYER